MTKDLHVDLCVIGGGAAGLSVAAGAVQLGQDVALIERATMGGECLNTGCVPSKALLAAAHAAHIARSASRYGITATPLVDYASVQKHLRHVIGKIEPHDSQDRFEGLGVKVVRENAYFTGPHTVQAGTTTIHARRFVIATGSTAAIPPIAGLDPARVLTNDTIFGLATLPVHLVIIGGGPVGVEMAQAHRRLGARVTLIERDRILPHDDADTVSVLRRQLTADDDIRLFENAHITRVRHDDDGTTTVILDNFGPVTGDAVLVAAGRVPRTADLNLDAAGVRHDASGIVVDHHLRTNRRHIFALGDCAGGDGAGPRLTHVAGYQAGIVIRNMLFKIPARIDYRAMPHVTYTDPEIAQVGMTQPEATRRWGSRARATIWTFRENDRAQAERDTQGLVKIITGPGGRIVGASIAGAGAGDMIAPWVLAVHRRLRMADMAAITLPYPTRSEAGKRAAGAYFSPSLFSNRTRMLVGWLDRLPF